MKLNWWRSRNIWNLEKHEAWLAAQARQGLHFKRRFGPVDQFEPGAPGEFAFCWDRAPMFGKEAKAVYYRAHAEGGWHPMTQAGGLVCWRRPVAPGEPMPMLRSAPETRVLMKRLITDQLWMGAALTYFTVKAYLALLLNYTSFPLGHRTMAVLGPIALAMMAYTLLRLKKRT